MKIIEKDTGIKGSGANILFANGKYFLLSSEPAKVCYSEDLKEWTEIQLNTGYVRPKDIVYGNGTYIITGNSGATNQTYIYVSNDGENWTPKIIDTGQNFSISIHSCKFINNKFVFISSWYNYKISTGVRNYTVFQFYETKDGNNIVRHNVQINGARTLIPMDIAYGNGLYVINDYTGTIFTSTNLSNWVERSSGTTETLQGINYGKSQFVVVGNKGTILTSKDGINWVKQKSGTDAYLIRSRYANGMYIVVGYNGVILQSIDGILWKNLSSKTQGLRYGLTYHDDRFVISATRYEDTKTIPIFYFDVTRNITVSEDDDSLFVFDKNLNMLGVIDSFISLRWHRKFFEAGDFEIVLPVTDYIEKMIDTDVLVMRNNYTEAGIIETIEYSDNGTEEEIIISGRFLSCLLERRIIKNKINFSGQSIEGMNTLVDSMTPLCTMWETSPVSMSSRNIQFQCTYKNVYDYLCRLSEYSNIGFRIVPNVDSKVYLFEAYAGKDRTSSQSDNEQYSFSDDNFNIEQGSLVISNKTKVNYVLVGGQGEDSNRFLAEAKTNATGFDLHEIFVDQKSLSKENLSDSAYRQQLVDIGESNITDGTLKFEVDATNIGDYKKKWDLGDIVNIKKEKWGIQTEDRIIEVEEVIEDGKKTIYPTFGSPLASAWKDE